METTIYFKCPTCGKTALVREMQGRYFCAQCNLDYMEIAKDKEKLDAALVDNMKQGATGILMAIALNDLLINKTQKEKVDYIKEIASKNGIKLPPPENHWPLH